MNTLTHKYLSNVNKKEFLCYTPQMISMLKRELGILFLVGCLILTSVPTALCRSPAPTIYVSGSGSEDFNCDGKDDQVQINQALKYVASNSAYTTVHLKGPFTYVINDTLLIGSNTTLEGDSSAVIKLADHAGWDTMKPLIKQMSSSGNNNIVIRGFEVNVNHDNNTEFAKGKGYYNIMYFTHSNNIKVYNMYMHDGHGDGMRVKYGENIQFYNNKVSKLGHDGLFVSECKNVEAWNNKITCRTNSGIRIWNSNKVKVHDNVIESSYYKNTGGPGIQIEKNSGVMDSIEIYNNKLYDTYGPGIWIFNYDTSSATKEQGKNVLIHNNIFYNTGTNTGIAWVGGIVLSGFHDTLIENNVFDGAYNAAIVHMYPSGYSPSYTSKIGYTTIVRNNIIVNTKKRIKDPSGTGYGVVNSLPETHSFVLENNCLYNNKGGKYKNCTSTTDIYVNPLFADQKNHEYHLQSAAGRWNGLTWVKDSVSSPCIDAGYSNSDYSEEPEPNGKRINIGRYGNTEYASKSKSYVITPILLVANFSSNITEGYAPVCVAFNDISTGEPTAWNWSFGDGAYSTSRDSVHTYNKAGNYNVSLTVKNEANKNTKTKSNYINVGTATTTQKPVASFWGSRTSGTAPLTITFTDASTNTPTAWNWSFGDGTTNATIKNPRHIYSKAGTYSLKLTATNAAGSGTLTRSNYIKVT
jgi:PKD repeat protein